MILLEKEKKQIVQKEEKKQRAHAKAAKENKKTGFPIYLAILLVVFGIAAGLAINSLFLSKTAQLPTGSANKGSFEETPIELKVVYNSDCNICYKGTNLEALLKQRNLKFSEELLDMKITENGVLAGNYGMTSFPSMLLNWKQLKLADLELFNTMKELFPINGDYFVIAEADLSREMQGFAPIMFLEAPVSERCGVKSGIVRIEEFKDYFSEYSYKNQGIIEAIEKDFNSSVEAHYRNFPSSEQSKKAAMAAECAKEQGMLGEYSKALYSALFEKNENISDPTILKRIAQEQKIPDLNAFDSCIDTEKTKPIIENDANAAMQYKLYFSPSVAIDCIFTTIETTELKNQICLIHPDFAACKKS